jgi:glycosyltransferase involved in cell wall biosynthesis
MRILFVAEPASIHTARWISQFSGLPWEIHVISGELTAHGVSPELRNATVHLPNQYHPKAIKFDAADTQDVYEYMARLCINKPFDIIHSLGLCVNHTNRLASIYIIRQAFPEIHAIPWIYSSWGMDLDVFADEHKDECAACISDVDYFISEGKRDLNYIHKFGFKGQILGSVPAFGGISWKTERGDHKRSRILVKGRDIRDGDPIGRAYEILLSLPLVKKELEPYTVTILQAGDHVRRLASVISSNFGIKFEIPGRLETHAEILALHRESELFISNTTNDGLPASLVEAMSLGAVPIHSDLTSIREWIENGKNGFLVNPLNPLEIAKSLSLALRNRDFLETARRTNLDIVDNHWGAQYIRDKAISFYNRVLQKRELRVN